MKLLEMVKDMKIKDSVFSPPPQKKKYGRAFFSKKIMVGEVFYLGSNIRSCKEGRWKDYGRIFIGMKD